MSRWRPPTTPSSPYITPAGYRRLEEESAGLWARRIEVTRALSAAAAEGDRSENAEYQYRKRELAGIDRRIGYLQRRLPELRIVTAVSDQSRVYFGAWVDIEEDEGAVLRVRIVGADELDSQSGHISIDSPLARALLGKQVGMEVTVHAGSRDRVYQILAIAYQ